MGIEGYDQWKTASPHDDDLDPIERGEKVIKACEWALLNWETDPGEWRYHLYRMRDTIKTLMAYIEKNT